jgi:lipopolysaccharide biosynthesis glycosyltransferase
MNTFSERINVLCATDNNYAPYCGIMLTSLLESNRDCGFAVFIFVDGCLSDTNYKKYKKLEQKYACEVHIMTIDDKLLEGCPINHQRDVDNHSWVSRPTYYRLLASELLPKEIQKVIYLDCDIAVVGNIKPLWNVDLTGKAIAGVTDCDEEKNRNRLGLSSHSTYINAGVALYNLEYWRENHVSESFFEYIRENEAKLLLMDQDVVNGVLYDKMQILPERYNFQVAFFTKE